MKKITLFTGTVLLSMALNAQENVNYDPFRDRDFIEHVSQAAAIVLVIYLISNFFLSIIRMFLDYKLKNKMMDKGASENIIQQFLQPQKKDARAVAVKWAIIVGGVGLGFTLMLLFPPFGIHSVMIMSFCISLSFLCYYYFIKKTEAQPAQN
jgi:ABC-type Fe3+-siderophore transport system permease subunit